MAKSKNTIENRIDYSILLPVLILLLVGMVSIFIATNFDYPKNLVHVMSQQLLWIFLGSVLAFVVMLFNTEFLWKVTPWLYILAWDLWFCLLFFIHLLWLPRQEQKTGSVLDQSPFFNHQNL